MIAVDTNVLLAAHRRDAENHERAASTLRALAEGSAAWGIPAPCLAEFLALATHPRIFDPPSTVAAAVAQVEAWVGSPSHSLLGDGPEVWPLLRELLLESRTAGARVHDARIAALCLAHKVSELLTADRDFARFPRLKTRNPLAAKPAGG